MVEQIASGQASSKEIQGAINDLGEDATEEMKKYLKQAQFTAKAQEMNKEFLAEADGLLGGMGTKMKSFVTNPLVAAVAILAQFMETQKLIGQNFGAMGITRFRDDLSSAQQEFKRMGLSGQEAMDATRGLADNFGISFKEAAKMSQSVGDIAKSTGISVDESTQLMGMLTEMGGMTEKGAFDLAKQAESLAVANGVAPATVLKDMSKSTESFAKFSAAGTQNLMRAAIQARKLGVEFEDIASSAEGMLDFQSSLNAEVQASVMLGRNVNLQKARELALTGDLEGFQKEILKQVGGQAKWDKMNVLQKKALADATNMSVEKLSKMVSKEKEAAGLAGELADQKVDDIIPEETLTAVDELLGKLQAMGMQIAETLGPALEFFVGTFGGLLGWIEEFIGIGPALIALFIAIKGQAIAAAAGNVVKAVAGFFAGAADGATKTAGFGTPALVAMAVAASVALFGMISKATGLIGDLDSPAAGKGKTRVATKEGQYFELSKNDDLLAAPGLSGFMNNVVNGGGIGGGAVINNVNTRGLEKQNQQTNQKMDRLISVMENAPKQIGRKVGSKFETIRNS